MADSWSPPFADLKGLTLGDARSDFVAALTVTFLAIPQGVAYAMIAGLPPVVGLYASFLPTIIASLLRSSKHAISGPSNAVSLLVGTAVAAHVGTDPLSTALVLALMVGVVQVAAGVLRLGILVDYISIPVVAGYITGAGTLIAIGQLPNLTATTGAGPAASVFEKFSVWFGGLDSASLVAIALSLSCAVAILLLRFAAKRLKLTIPSALIVLAIATAASWFFDFSAAGLSTVADLASVPRELPPLSLPELSAWQSLLPFAIAAAVLSLVESSSVSRTLAASTGQRLSLTDEFIGQGVGNVVAAFTSGYPVSTSLSRSAINHRAGAKSRLSGVFAGLLVGISLLAFGPALEYTPIAALAGLLLVVAFDLVDLGRISQILRGRRSDAIAFVATLVGTWVFQLDTAIYFGIGVSLFSYLRRARSLQAVYLHRSSNGDIDERDEPPSGEVHILQIDGQFFFAANNELESIVVTALERPGLTTLILRLRRAIGMDVTIATRLSELALAARASGKSLVLTGVDRDDRRLLERVGAIAEIGAANVYERTDRLFHGLENALGAVGATEATSESPAAEADSNEPNDG